MTFDAPVVLALAPLIGGAVWFAAAWARRVRIRRAALWSHETVRQAVAAGRLGPTALAVAAFLGVVALAGPRWGEERIVAETRGLSVVLAVDISRSMLAEDAPPSRLRRAVREARRLVQDLDGDRIGLIAFAGSSYIMSPLSIDGSALTLYLDALDPDMASQGGTGLAPALRQGGELLQASSELADRVLVVFTDGEAHDSLPPITAQAERLKADGIRLILVAEGGRNPSRIPVRDDHGVLLGYQKDEDGRVIETTRRDDMLGAAADAAQGTLVAADLPDQAGAVRDLVASYRRARASETRTEQSRPRAWLPLMLGVVLLVAQAASRRTAAPRRGAAGRAGRLAANRRARRVGRRVSHCPARERGAAAPTAAEPRGKGMGPSRPPARARRVPGGARRPSQRGRCLVQRGYRGIGRLGRRDGAGEPRARRRIARSRPAVPRVVQSRAARAAPGR